ncbi:MAG: MFS transporter, partial [Planctomycetaceae bacterium]|nr:MFS transporter [Planctomycetaceae bacterium]
MPLTRPQPGDLHQTRNTNAPITESDAPPDRRTGRADVAPRRAVMARTTLRLVLLVSCAHAMVHLFELSLPSVEQMIGAEFHVGREQTGMLGTVWRIPFGLGAVFTGWLVDRYGSKRLLLIYLVGCGAASLWAFAATSFNSVFLAMLTMGC